MAERKSKPRTAEVDLDEDAHRKGDRILFLGLVVGGIAIVILMIIVSNFLSGPSAGGPWLLGSFAATALLDVGIFTWGFLERRKVAR